MKIVVNAKQVAFRELKPGDVYCWYAEYYMKVLPSENYDTKINAVRLSDGDLFEQHGDSLVNPVNGTFEVG